MWGLPKELRRLKNDSEAGSKINMGPQASDGDKKVFGYEVQTIPPVNQAKLTLKDPCLSDVRAALEEMRQNGVPDGAAIGFQQWKIPQDNYYLIATWSPADGGRHQK